MNNIKHIWYITLTALIGAASWLLFRKVRKVEEMYDDALDAKAKAKLELQRARLATKREDYIKHLKEYNDAISNDDDATIILLTFGDGPYADRQPEPEGIIDEVRPSPEKLH